ncbi:MAG: OpgC domain-containing protein [Acidimicrobiia bacterium]|nr:OpgC domain-containing protein [Acidimicrobiia bacterium]
MQLRYDDPSARDVRLDLLRGFALFAMAINHVGFHNSAYHTVTGRSVFLINAAEGFFFISGMTLGFIAARDTVGNSVERLLRRTWVVYLTTIGIAAGFAALAVGTDLEVWGDAAGFAGTSAGEFLANVLTLRWSFHGSDVLVAYVVYLAVAALALWLLHRGRGWIVAGALLLVYAMSQLYPEATELPVAAFRNLASNSPVFFVGLLIGFYRRPFGEWWTRRSPPALRRTFDGAVAAAAIALLWLYATDYSAWPWLGSHLADTIGLREGAMPLFQLSIVCLYLRAFWLLADRLWVPIERITGWLLLPLGKASLFTYTAHLAAMVVIFNVPGISDDVSTASATLIVTGYVAIIFAAVKLRAGVRGWLAEQPASRQRLAGHLPATAAASLVAVVVATSPLWSSLGPNEDELADWRAEAYALAEYLEAEGVEYELIDEEWFVEVEIDWEDERSVAAFEEFWVLVEEGELERDL